MEADHSPYRDMNDLYQENDLFGNENTFASEQPKTDFSAERTKIEAELKLATDTVKNLQISSELKQELADFMVDYYDVTPDNVTDILEQATADLQEGMRSYLVDQGMDIAQDGTVDTTTERNRTALTNNNTEAGLEKYLELVSLNKKIQARKSYKYKQHVSSDSTNLFEVDDDGKLKDDENHHIPLFRENVFDKLVGENNETINPENDIFEIKKPFSLENILKRKSVETDNEEQERQNGIMLYQALEHYKFSDDLEDTFVSIALEKINKKQITITPENVQTILLDVADKLKMELTLGLIAHDFSLDSNGQLTLPENKKIILNDETIAWNVKLLEAAYKITDPGKNMGLQFTSLKAEPELAAAHDNAKGNQNINLVQELLQLNFSQAAVEAGKDELLLNAMGTSSIQSPATTQRGLAGFEQVIGRAVLALEKQVGFTLDTNKEPVLSENFLQKSLLAWNRANRINKAKNSPEYKRLLSLINLQEEVRQKKIELLKNSAKRKDTGEIGISNTQPKQKNEPIQRRNSLPVTALAGAAAGIMAGTALYKNQETDTLEPFDETTLVVPAKKVTPKNETSPTFSPRFEEIDSAQPRRPLSEIPTVTDIPATAARANESETARPVKKILEETKPVTLQKSTFKKTASFGAKPASKRLKIDPFTYQDTDPTTAPKLERPTDEIDYEEAPDLDNPPAYHKRLVEKTFKKPAPITKETVRNTTPKPVDRDKESHYLATPSVPGALKGPEEKVARPNLSLSKSNKQEKNKSPQPEVIYTESEVSNKMFFLSNDIYFKSRELADIEIDRAQIDANESTINPVLLANHEQKLQTDLDQLWATFKANKNQAIRVGEKNLNDLQAQLKNTSRKNEIDALTSQISALRGEIANLKELALHSKESFFQKIKEERARTSADAQKKIQESKRKKQETALKQQQQAEEDERLQKAEEETRRLRKLEPYPVLKPVKKKSNPTDQDLPTKRAA